MTLQICTLKQLAIQIGHITKDFVHLFVALVLGQSQHLKEQIINVAESLDFFFVEETMFFWLVPRIETDNLWFHQFDEQQPVHPSQHQFKSSVVFLVLR